MARRRTLIAAGTVTALVAAIGITQLAPGAAPVARAEGLTPYAGCGDLLAHYRAELRAAATPWGVGQGGYGIPGIAYATAGIARAATDSAASGAASGAAPAAAPAEVGTGPTGTNLQEQGVDEPDVAKLADGRIVAVARNRLQVLAAGSQPRLLGSLALGTKAQPYVSGELLVDGQRALVISQEYRDDPAQGEPETTMPGLLRLRPGTPTTRLLLVDLSQDEPRLLEEATYDGQYVSARLTGGTVRLVTSSSPRVAGTQPRFDDSRAVPSPAKVRAAEQLSLRANQAAAAQVSLSEVIPQVVRHNAGGTVLGSGDAVSCSQVNHASARTAGDHTLLVTTLRPAGGLAPVDSDAVTTDGDLVYASADRLYVATSRWGTTGSPKPIDGGPAIGAVSAPDAAVSSSDGTGSAVAPDSAATSATDGSGTSSPDGSGTGSSGVAPAGTDATPSATTTSTVSPSPTASPSPVDGVTTDLHAFDISDPTRTRYVGSGQVPGYVLGRWALSEDKGVLRVATTRQPPWQQDGQRQGETSSMLVKLAERDGRLVETGRVEGLGRTERIQAVRYFGDLAAVVTFRQTDPLYLVDLSEQPKVIGELKVPGFSTYLHPLGGGLLLGLGNEAASDGMITGSQVSVFDISDPTTPRQVDRLQLGTGYTPAQDESRAFSYDPTRRLVTLPWLAYSDKGAGEGGALGITVSTTGQLARAGLLAVGSNGAAPDVQAQRVLHDSDHLYAVTDSGVLAGDPTTLTRTGEARFAG